MRIKRKKRVARQMDITFFTPVESALLENYENVNINH